MTIAGILNDCPPVSEITCLRGRTHRAKRWGLAVACEDADTGVGANTTFFKRSLPGEHLQQTTADGKFGEERTRKLGECPVISHRRAVLAQAPLY